MARHFWKSHWKGVFSVAYPLALLSLFLLSTKAPMRCFYVLLLVSGYWILEVVALAVSAMIPLFLFPLMNLMDSDTVADCYSNNVMIFIGGIMIAIAVEYTNLHTRISFHVINKIGFSPRKLLVGLVVVTAFCAFWLSTTAATAMMIKIVYATLNEMEADGICQVWIQPPHTVGGHHGQAPPSSDSIPTIARSLEFQVVVDDHDQAPLTSDSVPIVARSVESQVAVDHHDQAPPTTSDSVPIVSRSVESQVDVDHHIQAPSSSDSVPTVARSMTSYVHAMHQDKNSDDDFKHNISFNDEEINVYDDALGRYDFASIYHMGRNRSRVLSNLSTFGLDYVEVMRRPTKITMCYFLSTAFAANISGMTSLVGSGPNKVLKGMFYAIFPTSEGITYMKWLGTTFPLMLVMLTLTTLWMQFFYLGLFRPGSKDALAISADVACQTKAKDMIKRKIERMPPMSFHEWIVAMLCVLVAILWLFRDPGFFPGWQVLNRHIKDDTVALGAFVLMFVIPAKPRCFRFCSKDETKRPKAKSNGLLTWAVVVKKFPWGLIFLLGGGVALAAGLKKSGTSQVIADKLESGLGKKQYQGMAIVCSISTLLTQIMCNATVPNIFLPIVAQLAVAHKVHPVYYMLPVTITCNLAFCLPASTPATAMACSACNIRTTDLLKMSIPVTIICVFVLFLLFPILASLIWKTDTYPAWADDITDQSNEHILTFQ